MQERNYAFNYVKFIAIIFVVGVHVAVFNGITRPEVYIIVSSFPRFVIPFFFMISGFAFGKKMLTIRKPQIFFKKYTIRMTKIFLFSYLLYFFYDLFTTALLAVYTGHNILNAIIIYIGKFLQLKVLYYGQGMSSIHLWYLTALIWSTVILYLFLKWKKLNLLLLFSLILNIIGLFGQSYSGIVTLPFPTTDALFFGLFYLTLGCYFAYNYDSIMKRVSGIKSTVFIALFTLFALIQIVERYITVDLLAGSMVKMDYYLSTIPLSISLFILLLKNPNFGKNSKIAKLGVNIGGIYVVHLLFISGIGLLINFFGLEFLKSTILFDIVLSLFIVAISNYLIVAVNHLMRRRAKKKISMIRTIKKSASIKIL